MLKATLAHKGGVLEPHDLWAAWSLDPLPLVGLVLVGWAYARGGHAHRKPAVDWWRARCFIAGLVVIGLALCSPLDPLAGALASAHMVQHVLLLLVAAPLLALSSPSHRLIRGSPPPLRRVIRRWRRRLGASTWPQVLRVPVVIWLVHVTVIWVWHASVPYQAALDHAGFHVIEHAGFLTTGVLFWSVVGGRFGRRVTRGYGIGLVFGMAMQSVFLSALLTFAETPWYERYLATTRAWGLEPLADQQLAGVIMWVPAGSVYLIAALTLTVAWIRETGPGTIPDQMSGAGYRAQGAGASLADEGGTS